MFKIIAITNRSYFKSEADFLRQVEKVAAAEVSAIVLREKDLPEEQYERLAKKVIRICQRHKVKCILHTYYDVARKLGQETVHLPLPLLRERFSQLSGFQKIGVSVHSVEDALEAEKLGASYVIAGHIFQTDCKKDLEPRGISFLQAVVNAVSIPVYAIGGVSPYNIEDIRRSKAAGACIMSGIMKAEAPDEYLGMYPFVLQKCTQ